MNELHQTNECHFRKVLYRLQVKHHSHQLIYLTISAWKPQSVPGNLLHKPRRNNETLQNWLKSNLSPVPQTTRSLGLH